MIKLRALAVRPYPDPLRSRVFELLSGLEVEVEAPAELGEGTSDEQAVRHLGDQDPDVLLVPFYVVRDALGRRTSGLALVRPLRQASPKYLDVPVVMPVSLYARVAFEAAWREESLEDVFPLFEHEVDLPETASALVRFLRPAN